MKERNSNIEILRLVSIFMITMHHLVIHGSGACGYGEPYAFDQGIWGIIINSFCIIGVNCFVLISGWYGIKNPIKASLRLLFDFVVITTLVAIGVSVYEGRWDIGALKHAYDIRNLWFIPCYICLAILSPYIEQSIQKMSWRTYTWVIIGLTVLNVVVCYGLQVFNPNGASVWNFIYLYYLARYLRIGKSEEVRGKSWVYAGVYVCASVLLAGGYFALTKMGYAEQIMGQRYFSYNNPVVIISALGLFMAFAAAKPTNSRMVNLIARGVFSAYVLQESVMLIGYRNEMAMNMYAEWSYWGLLLMGIIVFAGGIVLGVAVERIWRKMINNL